MTRMCVSCERQEMVTLLARVNANPPVVPAGAHPRTMRGPLVQEQWPYVTCTCLEKWQEHCTPGSDVCIQHRHRVACARHDKLLITRAQNDQWLRELARDVNNQNQLIHLRAGRPGHAVILNGRQTTGIYRACRCGEVPDINAVPQVFQCLGCEGVIHLTPAHAVGTALVLPPGFPSRVTRRSTRTTEGAFALRRGGRQ